jgi:hypothetical protein
VGVALVGLAIDAALDLELFALLEIADELAAPPLEDELCLRPEVELDELCPATDEELDKLCWAAELDAFEPELDELDELCPEAELELELPEEELLETALLGLLGALARSTVGT